MNKKEGEILEKDHKNIMTVLILLVAILIVGFFVYPQTAKQKGETVPAAPTDLAGTPGDTFVDLTWTAPSDGGFAITNYRVTYAIGRESTVDTESSSTSYRLEGLTNGEEYTISVMAENSLGFGDPSESIDVTPTDGSTAPDAPTALQASAGDGQVTLSWTAPEEDGGDSITGYVVSYTPSGGSTVDVSTRSTETSYVVTKLTNGTTYTFTVAAVNSVGTGSDSSGVEATPTDGTGPTISSLVVTPSTTTATFEWGTSELASSQVAYSLTSSIDADGKVSAETNVSPRVTGHTLTLTGLKSCSVYRYKARSKDASLNLTQSDSSTFTTTGCPGNARIQTDRSATSKVATSSGGTVSTSADGIDLNVNLPAGASDEENLFVQANLLNKDTVEAAISRPPGKDRWIGTAAQISVLTDADTEKTDSLDSPATVTLEYTDQEVAGLDESNLSIWKYNGGGWTELSNCSVNVNANTVSCEATTFSTFGIFEAGPSNLSQANVVFAQNLWYGVQSSDVLALQRFLNDSGFRLDSEGAGSPGEETNYFGPKTKKAVKLFQEAYKDSILSPLNLVEGTGFFGPKTREFINSL